MDQTSDLDAAFAALSHPARRAILARLAQGEATVNELAAPFEMSLPAISKHIRVLEGANLIRRSRKAQFRPCRINPEPLAAIVQWTQEYRHIWDARFDALEAALNDMTPKGGDDDD
ncbi:ArsR/SmtB family transcription factor [Yoonia litorea]|uniref:Transcriptional regulator, ArsR family n=1 Tax=Yoonia litorea TaxID=1123755 RepID=A0A1I6LET9_9RHOB|nr:metalloregulator ArsR/SmtB family transcription factor [Yoonia litorea]SFS01957.1 transcriptional regulator, ArsR family [Yoonia litorea]